MQASPQDDAHKDDASKPACTDSSDGVREDTIKREYSRTSINSQDTEDDAIEEERGMPLFCLMMPTSWVIVCHNTTC